MMFLDIHMLGLNEIEFLRSSTNRPKTIVNISFLEYAIDGFELEAFDYLLKPMT